MAEVSRTKILLSGTGSPQLSQSLTTITKHRAARTRLPNLKNIRSKSVTALNRVRINRVCPEKVHPESV